MLHTVYKLSIYLHSSKCIVTYYNNLIFSTAELPYIQVPLHTVMWLMQNEDSGEWSVSHVRLPVECVDTFRPRPKVHIFDILQYFHHFISIAFHKLFQSETA